MSDETAKITVTFSQDTMDWIEEQYPDGLSQQEQIRMAVSDARKLNRDHDLFLIDEER